MHTWCLNERGILFSNKKTLSINLHVPCIKASYLTICNTWYGSLCLETWDLMFNYLYYTSNIIHIHTHYSCVSATEMMSNQFCVFTTTFIKTTSSCITGYRNTYVHALSLSLLFSLSLPLSPCWTCMRCRATVVSWSIINYDNCDKKSKKNKYCIVEKFGEH